MLLCRFLPAFPRDSDGRIGARLFVFERAPVGRGNRVLLSSNQAIKVERFAFSDRFWIIIIVTTYYKFIRAVCWNGLDDFFFLFLLFTLRCCNDRRFCSRYFNKAKIAAFGSALLAPRRIINESGGNVHAMTNVSREVVPPSLSFSFSLSLYATSYICAFSK